MKEINLKISDEVFDEIKSSIITKKICGSFFGSQDEFCNLIMVAIDKNMKIVSIIREKPKKKKRKKK